jgi:hypothetical protein
MAPFCTVGSIVTRSNPGFLTVPIEMADSIEVLSNCSTPASPSTPRKRLICAGSYGSLGS